MIIVRRAQALSAAQEDEVVAHLPRLGETGRLVLVAKGLDQRRKLQAACAKAGAAIACARIGDHRTAATWVGTLARERGRAIGSAAIDRLLDRTGFDLGRIDDELEKLSLRAAQGAPIGVEDVETLVASTRGHAVEELTDASPGAIPRIHPTLRPDRGRRAPPARGRVVTSNLRRALHVSEPLATGCTRTRWRAGLMPPWLVAKQRAGDAGGARSGVAAPADVDVALSRRGPRRDARGGSAEIGGAAARARSGVSPSGRRRRA